MRFNDLIAVNLNLSNLTGANLTEANLQATYLWAIDLDGACLKEPNISCASMLAKLGHLNHQKSPQLIRMVTK